MKKNLPKFVALFFETLDAPAWLALSHGARLLYTALKRNLNVKKNNNGRLFLSHRQAAIQLGASKNCVSRWYAELQFYGFIVMTAYAGLGTDGKGRSAQWRLTEWECDGKPATRDFLKWDGKRFNDRRQYRQLRRSRKRKTLSQKLGHPVPKTGTYKPVKCPKKWDIEPVPKSGT
jgi:hypothetical protein